MIRMRKFGSSSTTLGKKIESHIVNLLPAFDLTGRKDHILTVYEMLTRESLALSMDAPIPRFSTINHDGVPFEFSLSLGNNPGGLRFLTEIGVPGASLPVRINQTCRRLNELGEYLQFNDAGPGITTALKTLLPANPSGLAGWRGGIWVGAGFSRDGRTRLKMYVNAADGPVTERWQKMGLLLKELGRGHSLRGLSRLSPVIPEYATPLGVAMDSSPNGIGRIKLYFRTFRYSPAFIESVFAKTDFSEKMEDFHEFSTGICTEQPAFPPSSLVLSAEFPHDATDEVDIKIDACAHCLFTSDRSAELAVSALLKSRGLDHRLYDAVLQELSGTPLSGSRLNHHVFFGVGYSHKDGSRFNIYLKPAVTAGIPDTPRIPRQDPLTGKDPGTRSPPPAPGYRAHAVPRQSIVKDLRRSVSSAVTCLLSRQSPGGQWLDFALPPGPSDAWVTGYTGLALARLPPEFRTRKVNEALRCAQAWCGCAMNPDYGWGYNSTTGSDADSTGYVISFLSAGGCPVPDACYRTLLSFQQRDGGFATYRLEDPGNTWGHSHPDVTPVAVNALLTSPKENRSLERSALDYILSGQDKDGIWQSYWWNTFLYSTWVNVCLLEKMGQDYRNDDCRTYLERQPVPDDPFRLALYAGALCQVSRSPDDSISGIGSIFDRLVHLQSGDGSWIGHPKLRLTNDRMTDPWRKEDSGEVFVDGQHLFTTATALTVLVSFYTRLLAEPDEVSRV